MAAPQWKGLFEWSMKYRDGTRPTDWSQLEVDPERLKWLEEALQSYLVDFGARMTEIKDTFDAGEENTTASLDERIALLEELQDIVSSIDHARNLHRIGGLSTLLELLESPRTPLRWRAAEVVATCVANNPPVQKDFMDEGVLPPLLALLQDEDPTCQAKGLLAISGLIRNFPAGEGAFLEAGGIQHLIRALKSKNLKLQWRSLFIFQYLLSRDAQHRRHFVGAGAVPLLKGLIQSEDVNARESALSVALEVAKDEEGRQAIKQAQGLKAAVHERRKALSELTGEDLDAVADELPMLAELAAALNR